MLLPFLKGDIRRTEGLEKVTANKVIGEKALNLPNCSPFTMRYL